LVGVCGRVRGCGKVGLVGGEQLVGYFYRTPSRRGLQSGLALTGSVCCASQRPAKSVCFGSCDAANNFYAADQGVSNGHSL